MTQIIAHRGSSYLAPENTQAAVELAWQEGADAVEVDVHMTSDRHIVAIHDEGLLRTGGVDRRIDAMTLAEVQAIDVGRWKGEQFAGHSVPTLAALLQRLPVRKQIFVEVKCGSEIVDGLARVVTASKSPIDVVIIGMSLPAMHEVKRALPMCPVHGVIEFDEKKETANTRWTSAALLENAERYRLEGLDLDTRGPITPELVSDLKTAGLGVGVWTVDSPHRARELIAAGVEGITTNRPGWLRDQLGL
jgi:glycerophosphoryl diester phosphodiesterase